MKNATHKIRFFILMKTASWKQCPCRTYNQKRLSLMFEIPKTDSKKRYKCQSFYYQDCYCFQLVSKISFREFHQSVSTLFLPMSLLLAPHKFTNVKFVVKLHNHPSVFAGDWFQDPLRHQICRCPSPIYKITQYLHKV